MFLMEVSPKIREWPFNIDEKEMRGIYQYLKLQL